MKWPFKRRHEINLEARYIMVDGEPQLLLTTDGILTGQQFERIAQLFRE